MEKRQKIIAQINHQQIEISGEKAFMPLGNFLREELHLTGTKIVCAEGDCGACTVLMSKGFDDQGRPEFMSINSCIIPMYLVDGAQVISVEGIASDDKLSEVQAKMIEKNGAQCGYCTPGFICAMSACVEKAKCENKTITEKNAKNALTGNLCRCTGYQSIIEALTSVDTKSEKLLKDRYHNKSFTKLSREISETSVEMKVLSSDKNLFIPTTLPEALKLKNTYKNDLRIVGGATDLGVVSNKGKIFITQALTLHHIKELKEITHNQNELIVGAGVTLAEFENYIEKYFKEMSDLLHIFASPQIKNRATLIGNVVNASPIADTIPFLMVSDAIVVLASELNTREVMLKDFYLDYKECDISPSELVTKIKIPLLKANEKLNVYKASMRKDLDISAVTFSARSIIDSAGAMSTVKIAFGGVAGTVIRLQELETYFNDKKLSSIKTNHLLEAQKILENKIKPLSDVRGSSEYRMIVAKNFVKKWLMELGCNL